MNQVETVIGTTNRVAKNTGALLTGIIVSKLCSLALFAIGARYLGPAGFGKYNFAISFSAIFIILGDLGLNTIAIREVARDKNQASKYLGNIYLLKTILSAIAITLIFLIISLLKNYPPETKNLVYIIGISVFFNSLSSALRWIFQAFQQMEWEGAINIVHGILILGLGFIFLYLGKGVIGLGYAHLLTNTSILIFSFLITTKKFVKLNFEIDLYFWRLFLKTALPIGITFIIAAFYLNIDTIMLSLMKGDKAVGFYNAGYRLVGFFKIGSSMLIMALFPVLSNYYKASIKLLMKTLKQFVYLIGMFSFPLGIVMSILSFKIIPLIYGEKFLSAIPALQILIWAGIFAFFSGLMGHTLIAGERQKLNAYVCFLGLIINLILNLILIPKYSYLGAAMAIVIAEFMVTFLVFISILHYIKINPLSTKIIKVVSASLLMGVFTWFTKQFSLSFVIFSSILLYIGILIIIKEISIYDLKLIRHRIPVKK